MPDNTADDVSVDVLNSATTPASVSVDGTTVSARPIAEKILARNDAAAQSAASRPAFGIRMTKLVPPGAG